MRLERADFRPAVVLNWRTPAPRTISEPASPARAHTRPVVTSRPLVQEAAMKFRAFVHSIGVVFLASTLAYGQQSASSGIIGQVADSSRASVPGATVTVTNVGTNAQRSATTDGEGRFSIPNLAPATYDIKVEL